MSVELPSRHSVEDRPVEEIALHLLDHLVGSVAQVSESIPRRDAFVRDAALRVATDALREAGETGTIRMESSEASSRLPVYVRALTEAWDFLTLRGLLVDDSDGATARVTRNGLLIAAMYRREGKVPPSLDPARWEDAATPILDAREASPSLLAGTRDPIRLADPPHTCEGAGEDGPPPVPSVFVSWAHSDRGMASHIREEWSALIYEFCAALIANGINAEADLFNLSDPSINWQNFGPQAIANADYVFVAVSRGWTERYEGTNPPTEGAGAAREADNLKGMFDRDQNEFQKKVKLHTSAWPLRR